MNGKRDEERGHIGFNGGFGNRNYLSALNAQARDPHVVGGRPYLINFDETTMSLYVAAGELLGRCTIFRRKLMQRRGILETPMPPARRKLFADVLKEATCCPGDNDFEAFTFALLKLGRTVYYDNDGNKVAWAGDHSEPPVECTRSVEWFDIHTDDTEGDTDSPGTDVIMLGLRHVDGPNDPRFPDTVVFSFGGFHHLTDGTVGRFGFICYTRRNCGDSHATELAFYKQMSEVMKSYINDCNGGMHFYQMSLSETMTSPAYKKTTLVPNKNQVGWRTPPLCRMDYLHRPAGSWSNPPHF